MLSSLSAKRTAASPLSSSKRNDHEVPMMPSSPVISSGTSASESSLGARKLLPHVSSSSSGKSASRASTSEGTSSRSLPNNSWSSAGSSSATPFRNMSSNGRLRKAINISACDSTETCWPSTFKSSSLMRTPCRAAQLCTATACTWTRAGGSARGNQPMAVNPSGTLSTKVVSSESSSVTGGVASSLRLEVDSGNCSSERGSKHISHRGCDASLR
mmetsp:Transcript_36273/g.104343  ORF Transcript_36273/g.104343 Transcript_36273/m.104343 type:complete len:215 (-) Transcript_36273:469-1113(-)